MDGDCNVHFVDNNLKLKCIIIISSEISKWKNKSDNKTKNYNTEKQ